MIKLALIGAGKWGKNYLQAVSSFKDTKIKYICALSKQTLTSFPNTYIKTLAIDQLIMNKDINGYIVATPAKTHFSIVKQLLLLGNNLLIEKPFAIDYIQALELQRVWQFKKPQVLVGHTYLYNPAYQAFKNSFKSLDHVKSISFEGLSSPSRKDVSVIWDWGPHPISILLDLINQPITKIAAKGLIQNPKSNLYDTVNASIEFSNGIEALIHISWFGSNKVRRLVAKGDNGKIEFDDTNINQQKIVLYQDDAVKQYPIYSHDAPLTKELEEFILAIKNKQMISSDLNTGVQVTRTLSAIELSVKNKGELVKLDQL